MAWFWTDDLARTLLAEGRVEERRVQDWMTRPMAVAAAADADPIELARRLLGVDLGVDDDAEVAGAA